MDKLPIVKEGSWLAKQLRDHDLKELILDWDSPYLLTAILERLTDARVKEKLTHMRLVLEKQHGIKPFAQAIHRVLTTKKKA